MMIDHILRESRMNLRVLARAARVDLGYLKQLSAGNAGAGRETREKIATALERHSEALRGYAAELRSDQLEAD